MSVGTVNAKHEALLTKLLEQVENLISSGQWQSWLKVAARFRKYSFHNQLLILAQRPDATRVAGYRAWMELGRHVRKGEKGIAIFAPLTRKVTDDETGEERRAVTGFRIVHVFDLSQTEGEPLPEPEFPAVQLDDEAVMKRLVEATEKAGFQLVDAEPEEADGARGWFDLRGRATITLVTGYPTASRARTLLHELAHSCDPELTFESANGLGRTIPEVVAESAAYIIGTGLGIEMSDASTFYVASWLRDTDPEKLELVVSRTSATADRLEQLVSPAFSPA